jgi:choline dehydrogenase-like flavoprotein
MQISKKEKAVVVIGSGPGGATVAHQLTIKGPASKSTTGIPFVVN